jgi:hypothetical protein
MDYEKLKSYVIQKLMDTTLAWNAKSEVYPVKPAGMTDAQEAAWTMVIGGSKLGSLSDMESTALRQMVSESLGVKIPTKPVITFKNPPPYVCLTVTKEGVRYLDVKEDRLILHKLSGAWAPEGSNKPVSVREFASNWTRLPTIEEIERMVCSIPENALAIVMSGMLPLKKTPEITAHIETLLRTNSEELFKQRPTLEGITPKEVALYRHSHEDVGIDYVKVVMTAVDLVWDSDKSTQVKSYYRDVNTFTPPPFSSVCIDGAPQVLLSASTSVVKKTLTTLNGIAWDNVTPLPEEEFGKLAKSIPIEFCLAYLPEEMVNAMLEEVKLE